MNSEKIAIINHLKQTINKQEAQGALRRSPGYVANQLKNYPDNLVEISNIGMFPAKFG